MSTSRARPRFSKLPKVPLLWAETPPPQAVIPTFIRLIPIKVTTMPDTRGVIILRVYFKMRLMTISTDDATMQVPKISGSPPSIPAEMIGPINEKLVPWIHKRPVPIPPIRLHWIKVEIPEAKRDMDTRKLVVSKSSFNAPAMIRGGVMMATKIASKCCMAAKWPLVQEGGRSIRKSVRYWIGRFEIPAWDYLILISQLSRLSMIASDSMRMPALRK